MPLYKFYCEKCNKEFENFKKLMERDSEEKCPKCGKICSREFSNYKVNMGAPSDHPVKMNKRHPSSITRTPIYSDRKTGKRLGLGKPEKVKMDV